MADPATRRGITSSPVWLTALSSTTDWRQAMFAQVALSPGGFIAWAVVGLISGWLAGKVMKGSGYGVVGDVVVGLVGALVGGFVVSLFATGATGFWGSIVVAFLGACLCIAVVRAIAGRRVV
jgi:uncharacterized membrane protein YeaQ/YmgE (transglycosylase-associated protein family)